MVQATTLLTFILQVLCSNLSPITDILIEVSRGFRQSPYVNTEIAP
jgi:hypothetical protein